MTKTVLESKALVMTPLTWMSACEYFIQHSRLKNFKMGLIILTGLCACFYV